MLTEADKASIFGAAPSPSAGAPARECLNVRCVIRPSGTSESQHLSSRSCSRSGESVRWWREPHISASEKAPSMCLGSRMCSTAELRKASSGTARRCTKLTLHGRTFQRVARRAQRHRHSCVLGIITRGRLQAYYTMATAPIHLLLAPPASSRGSHER